MRQKQTLLDTLQSASMYLTFDCNLKCSYCFSNSYALEKYNDLMEDPKAIDNIVNFINQLRQPEFKLILFGGEPSLKWDVCKEIYHACETRCNKKVTFHLQTNGTLLADKVDDLLNMPLLDVYISFDAFKENHDRYRVFEDGSGSWDIINQNVQTLLKTPIGPRMAGVWTWFPYEAKKLGDEVIGLFEMGFRNVRTGMIKEVPATDEDQDNLYLSYVQIVDYLMEHPDCKYINFNVTSNILNKPVLEKHYQKYLDQIDFSSCKAGVYKAWISPSGDVYPCPPLLNPKFLLGNVFTGKFTKMSETLIDAYQTTQCVSKCSVRTGCQRCYVSNMLHRGTLLHCGKGIEKASEVKYKALGYLFESCIKHGYLDERK